MHGTVLVVIDQPASIGALPIAVACDMGCLIAHLPGRTMRRIVDLYPGEAKTDARDAFASSAAPEVCTPPPARRRNRPGPPLRGKATGQAWRITFTGARLCRTGRLHRGWSPDQTVLINGNAQARRPGNQAANRGTPAAAPPCSGRRTRLGGPARPCPRSSPVDRGTFSAGCGRRDASTSRSSSWLVDGVTLPVVVPLVARVLGDLALRMACLTLGGLPDPATV